MSLTRKDEAPPMSRGRVGMQIENQYAGQVSFFAGSQREQTIRVVVADDQRLFRESLAGILSTHASLQVVGVVGDGLEAVDLVRSIRPDVVLMDVKMPHMDGIEATRQIKAGLPETRG